MQELAAAARPSSGLRAFDWDGPSSHDLIEVLASDHIAQVTDWVDASWFVLRWWSKELQRTCPRPTPRALTRVGRLQVPGCQ
jgi:hypothetical protein